MEKVDSIKISIIMPVHNTGIYLEEALESIFLQSFREFELICVDDASTDKLTKEILMRYRSLHKNMYVIWLKENVGAGKARNIGFKKVQGEYVIFLDADDVFAEELLEEMYQCIGTSDADVCVCGHEEFYTIDQRKCFGTEWVPDQYKINGDTKEKWLLNISTVAWDKLCRVRYLRENNIYFQSLPSCNDVFFSCSVMINTKKRCYVKKSLLFYRINTGNQISTNRNPVNLYKAIKQLYNVEKKGQESSRLQKQIGVLLLRNGIWELNNSGNELNKQRYYNFLYEFFKDNEFIFQNSLLKALTEKIKNLPNEYKWLCGMDFYTQLRLTVKELKERIKVKAPIYLWGTGYRGNIFQQVCKEQAICLQGVADIKNCNVGEKTKYGYRIVSTETVLRDIGVVIASNEEIYESLLKYNLNLINLGDFYLF